MLLSDQVFFKKYMFRVETVWKSWQPELQNFPTYLLKKSFRFSIRIWANRGMFLPYQLGLLKCVYIINLLWSARNIVHDNNQHWHQYCRKTWKIFLQNLSSKGRCHPDFGKNTWKSGDFISIWCWSTNDFIRDFRWVVDFFPRYSISKYWEFDKRPPHWLQDKVFYDKKYNFMKSFEE